MLKITPCLSTPPYKRGYARNSQPTRKQRTTRKTTRKTTAHQVTNCGVPYPGLEWKIVDVDDFDRELARDGEAQGELLLKGPNVMLGYLNR